MQGDAFKIETTKEDFEIGFKLGFKGIFEHKENTGQTPRSSLKDKVNKNQSTLTFH